MFIDRLKRRDLSVSLRLRFKTLLLCFFISTSLLSEGLDLQYAHADDSSQDDIRLSLAVHGNVQVSEIQQRELSMIFSGRRRTWSQNNQPIQLILLPSGSEEMAWLSKLLKMPEHLVRRFIFRRVYQGTMRQPIEVNSTEEALKALAMNPGAIAPIKVSAELSESIVKQADKRDIRLISMRN